MRTAGLKQKSAGKHKGNKKNFHCEENGKTFFKINHESAEKRRKGSERRHARHEPVFSCGKASNTAVTKSSSPAVKSSSPENECIITEIKKITFMFFYGKNAEINNLIHINS
jgi:hypothetical protein